MGPFQDILEAAKSVPNPITTILAALGTLLGAVSLGWNIYRGIIDKGSFQVTAFIGYIIEIGGGPQDSKNHLILTITNNGRRPVMLVNIGGGYSRGTTVDGRDHFVLNPKPERSYPGMLSPREYVTVWIDDLSLLNQKLEFLGAYDFARQALQDKTTKAETAHRRGKGR